jgi:hypothetical protein
MRRLNSRCTDQRPLSVQRIWPTIDAIEPSTLFLFGDRGSRRKVYYLAECSRLPVFRLGSVLCARKSVLLQWISGQERRVKGSLA